MLRRGSADPLTQHRGTLRRQTRGTPAPESDFLAQLTLLQQARECHFDEEACLRLGILSGAAREICRSWQDLLRLTPREGA